MSAATTGTAIINDQCYWWLAVGVLLCAVDPAGNQSSIQFNSEKFEQEEART